MTRPIEGEENMTRQLGHGSISDYISVVDWKTLDDDEGEGEEASHNFPCDL